MVEQWISGFLCINVYRIQYTCTIGMGSKSTSEINKICKLPVRRSQISVKLPLNKLHTTICRRHQTHCQVEGNIDYWESMPQITIIEFTTAISAGTLLLHHARIHCRAVGPSFRSPPRVSLLACFPFLFSMFSLFPSRDSPRFKVTPTHNAAQFSQCKKIALCTHNAPLFLFVLCLVCSTLCVTRR